MNGSVRGATSVSCVGWLAALGCLAVGVLGTIPDGYNLKVQTSCGDDHVTDATIAVVTDLPDAMVSAVCPAGQFDFSSSDGVNFVLPVSYPGQGGSPCLFKKRLDSETYVVLISVSYGEDGNRLQQGEEYYTITCTFDPNRADDSPQQTIDETLAAPVELQVNNGLDTSSSLTLTLADILGDDLDPSEPVVTGRQIVLKLKTDGSSGELGIRPVSCYAVYPSTGSRYSVLRAGCGDGIVFPRHSGFETTNFVATSPYFESFGIDGKSGVAFECNITLCNSNCDGRKMLLSPQGRCILNRFETSTEFLRGWAKEKIYSKKGQT